MQHEMQEHWGHASQVGMQTGLIRGLGYADASEQHACQQCLLATAEAGNQAVNNLALA